ncbi:crotonase/enoyl-CoA hydratase family protein [Methylobacterium sp. J-030]|uniref:crotonase/enoyl-CoA hydratase family protein n=1 Tax=Methylobacterium sp. J-030 TaxID=2836627 RepID=UPI001FB9D729|nr:crotonase/enoyl-CoA hydratase family protein [Methylobacterium sp. J-030]MCJ2072196.1 crotonase/enoyl-CoA hydratase family protein [Methylobacterium sp. J-030]
MAIEQGTVLVQRDGPVTTVTINRPEVRNALDIETAARLFDAFQQFEADASASVAVLTGAGGSFCSGADLKELATGRVYEPWATGERGPTRPFLCKPVIAAVSGHACAGGLGLALWCDLRVADEDTTFAVLSRRWGVPMSEGTTVRLPRLIGMSRALDMLLTARPIHGREAVEIGLANRLAPRGTVLAVAHELANEIAIFPSIAMRSDRHSAYVQWALPLEDALAKETELAAAARAREAVSGAARFASGAGRHGEKA